MDGAGLRVVLPSIGRYLAMPPQDLPTQSHATDKTVAVVVPAASRHGKERKRRRKHEDGAAGAGVVAAAAPSENDAADGAHHRQPRTPASERTRTEAGSSKYDDGGGAPRLQVQFSESASATARPADVLVGSMRKYRAADVTYSTVGGGDSYYASDDHFAASPPPHSKPAKPHAAHYSAASSASAAAAADGVHARVSNGGHERYDSPSVAARPNGLVNGGKHRHHQAANHADDYAVTSISSPRLVMMREPAAPPPLPVHHRPHKPHKDHEAPSSSAPAPPAPEPSEDELLRVGLEVASMMDTDTLHSMVKEYVVGRNQQEAEAVEEERPPFWRPLTDDEADADLRAVHDKVAARKAAASGSGKRRRH